MSLQTLKSAQYVVTNPYRSLLLFQATNRPLIEFQVAKSVTCTISDHYICPAKHENNIQSSAVLYGPLLNLEAL